MLKLRQRQEMWLVKISFSSGNLILLSPLKQENNFLYAIKPWCYCIPSLLPVLPEKKARI